MTNNRHARFPNRSHRINFPATGGPTVWGGVCGWHRHLFAPFSNVNKTHGVIHRKCVIERHSIEHVSVGEIYSFSPPTHAHIWRWKMTCAEAINIHTFGFGTRSASPAGYWILRWGRVNDAWKATHVMDHGGDGVVSRCIYVVNMHAISGRVCTATKVSTSNWMLMRIVYFECKQWNRLSACRI